MKKQKSLKQLQKHLKFCFKCQKEKYATKLCSPLKKYIQKDRVKQSELSVNPTILDQVIYSDFWSQINDISQDHLQPVLERHVRKLSALDREIIHLYYWKGQSLRKIATILGFKSNVTILNRLRKLRKTLRDSLTSENTNIKSFQDLIKKNERIAIGREEER